MENPERAGQAKADTKENATSELTHYFHRVAEHAAKAFLENYTVTAF